MKQVIVSVPENKLSVFMKLMHSLNFVKVVDAPLTLEEQLTPAQKKIWENVKQGFIELKLAGEGKLELRPIQELLDEL